MVGCTNPLSLAVIFYRFLQDQAPSSSKLLVSLKIVSRIRAIHSHLLHDNFVSSIFVKSNLGESFVAYEAKFARKPLNMSLLEAPNCLN